MSRTRKGKKSPGWEPWSNRHEKAAAKADFQDDAPNWTEDECRGCRSCICIKCGGHLGHKVMLGDEDLKLDPRLICISCGYEELGE